MLTNAFIDVESRKKYIHHWKTFAKIMNSMGLGQKSMGQWQRVLSDLVSKTKAAYLKKDINKTGGGPATTKGINEHEKRLIAIKGWSSVEEDGSTREFGIDLSCK